MNRPFASIAAFIAIFITILTVWKKAMPNTTTVTIPAAEHRHVLCWKSILAGAVAAASISLVLAILGSGFGLALASPFDGEPASTVGITAAVASWILIMQWASSALGGYIAGRLRHTPEGLYNDEVYFRDTAHGFLTWAVATVFTAVVVAGSFGAALGGGAKAGMMMAHGPRMAAGPHGAPHMDYSNDLFAGAAPVTGGPDTARMESNRLLLDGLKEDSFPQENKDDLTRLVETRAGVSQEEAAQRVDATVAKAEEDKDALVAAAEKARKASSALSIITAISMLLGAFIAAVAALIGGRHRDHFPVHLR